MVLSGDKWKVWDQHGDHKKQVLSIDSVFMSVYI